MEKVRLGDICNIKSSKRIYQSEYTDKGVPFYRGKEISELSRGDNPKVELYISRERYNELQLKFGSPKKGDLLITSVGTIGNTWISDGREFYYKDGNITQIVNNDKINTRYLLYLFKSDILKRQYVEGSTGTAQVALTIEKLNNLVIPIRSLEIQQKIVEILDKAQELIDKRKAQIEELDELVKSRFIEMFGNPVSNPKSWNKDTIGSVVKSIITGWSANGEAREKREGEKAVLKVSAVTQGYFKEDEYKVIDDDLKIKKYVFPEKGDLLFSRANTREMVGATCIIHKDYPDLLLPDKLWKVLFVDSVNVFYMKYILSEPAIRAEFSAKSTGTSGSMYNVSMDKFKNIEIPVPPIDLQNQFAAFVNQVDKLKFETQKSLEELENLFNSLMQKALKGELEFN